MINFREIRKAHKVRVKDIPIHPKTVKQIEDNKNTMSVKALETYCESIGVKIIYSL